MMMVLLVKQTESEKQTKNFVQPSPIELESDKHLFVDDDNCCQLRRPYMCKVPTIEIFGNSDKVLAIL